jgi:hypothetical protein
VWRPRIGVGPPHYPKVEKQENLHWLPSFRFTFLGIQKSEDIQNGPLNVGSGMSERTLPSG